MKNAAQPSSASARAVARQTGTYDTSVLVARTTRIRSDAGSLAMRASGRPVLRATYRSRIPVNPRLASAACSACRVSSQEVVIFRFSSSDSASERTFVFRRDRVMI